MDVKLLKGPRCELRLGGIGLKGFRFRALDLEPSTLNPKPWNLMCLTRPLPNCRAARSRISYREPEEKLPTCPKTESTQECFRPPLWRGVGVRSASRRLCFLQLMVRRDSILFSDN